jgi:flagellar L-ring protein precursor FlgH
LLSIVVPALAGPKILNKEPQKTALDEYIEQAHKRAEAQHAASPGSLFSNTGTLADIATDFHARAIDDMVTIVVSEQASAVSTGQTKTSRASSANSAITSLAAPLKASSALSNLLNTNTTQSLDGEGTTSRTTTLSTTLSARVVDVLPNGYLVVQGSKTVVVNSENQVITVRGVVRPADLSSGNMVQSDSIAQLELKINGRGVVNDSIRRPNFLYRLLLGLLPF